MSNDFHNGDGLAAAGPLRISTEAERPAALDSQDHCQGFSPASSVHELVERQVRRTPLAVAVVFGQAELSYQELNRRANQLAHFLVGRGVGPEALVGICAERSLDAAVGLLAILKAGAAYLPLDPTYPKERLAVMLEDARPSLLLAPQRMQALLPDLTCPVVCLDADRPAIAAGPDGNLPNRIKPDHLAYVLYTSGSTGKPKGVAMTHRALVNLLVWQKHDGALPKVARTLQFASLCFDVSFQEIFSTWSSGGTLILAPEEVRRDPGRLVNLLAKQAVQRAYLPPVVLKYIAEAAAEQTVVPAALSEIITAGEQLQITPAVGRFVGSLRACVLHNHYGPTEAHVVTAYTLKGAPSSWPTLPPIGFPITNVRIHLLDVAGNPVPPGEAGELFIGGVCLARGYLGRPELTAERFVPDPFGGEPGARLYRTGDLARHLPDGGIEYLGRADHQVKIRGFRIELGEIEAALVRHPEVHDAVTVVREDQAGDKQLVAYFVSNSGPAATPRALRNFLKQSLPAYMVPSILVPMEHMPLSANGKVDRRALPVPDTQPVDRDGESVAPRNNVERQLLAVWEKVLGIHPLGVTDNIFDLGINSLAAARLFAQIEKVFGQRLPPGPLFQAPTVEQLAKLLERSEQRTRWTSLVVIKGQGSRPALFGVHGGKGTVFVFHQLARHLAANQPVYALQMQGLFGNVSPHDRVEAMAAHYLAEIRDVQPQGPYFLAGYCFGGIVALEMAQQLRRHGQTVALLALLDAPSPVYLARHEGRLLPEVEAGQAVVTPVKPSPQRRQREPDSLFGKLTRFLSRKIRHVHRRLSRILRLARCWLLVRLRRQLPTSLRDFYFLTKTTRAERAYRPQIYPGRICLMHNQRLYDDCLLGWNGLAAEIEFHDLPGEPPLDLNRRLMEEPNIRWVAATIQNELDRGHRLAPEIPPTLPEAGHGSLTATATRSGPMAASSITK